MNDKIVDFLLSGKFYGPIITILLAIIFYNIFKAVINKAVIMGKTELDKKRRTTLLKLFQNVVFYFIAIVVIIIILGIYGVNTVSILSGLGIVGVVIGLALQDALKDIIGGINIIMDNYYVIGDLVKYNDFTGTVSEFGLKSTKIIDWENRVLVVANRNVSEIINLSYKQNIVIIQVPTAYEETEERVKKALNKVLEEVKKMEFVDEKETKYLGINALDESSVNYLIQIKCEKGKGYQLKRDVLAIIKNEYEKNNIKIPYNQLEVHNGSKI